MQTTLYFYIFGYKSLGMLGGTNRVHVRGSPVASLRSWVASFEKPPEDLCHFLHLSFRPSQVVEILLHLVIVIRHSTCAGKERFLCVCVERFYKKGHSLGLGINQGSGGQSTESWSLDHQGNEGSVLRCAPMIAPFPWCSGPCLPACPSRRRLPLWGWSKRSYPPSFL